MAGKYVIRTDRAGEFRFDLVAANGEVIATSEGYSTKASAIAGIESVRSNGEAAEVVDQTT
jgi:uncharacterized protein YegP (UPF0339 family)